MSEFPVQADVRGSAPSTRHLPALDGVRGLAVLTVFLFHYGGGTHSPLRPLRVFGLANKAGWTGVVLFFVLSGFLITGILWDSFDDPHWWRKFFARRSLRIFPLYFLALVLVLLGALPQGTFGYVLTHLWVPALFLEDLPRLQSINDNLPSYFATFHLWSIAVEEQFYLLWPFLLVLQRSRKRAKMLCVAVFVLSAVFRFAVYGLTQNPGQWEKFLLSQAGALATGGWLALSYRGPEWTRIVRWAPASAWIGLVGFAASGIFSRTFVSAGGYMMTFGLPFATLLFASLVALAITPGIIARAFSMGWLRWLGGISYGIYVFHILLVRGFNELAQRLAGSSSDAHFLVLRLVLAAAGSVGIATLSFHLYEKQFLRLKKYFLPRTRPSASSGAPDALASALPPN